MNLIPSSIFQQLFKPTSKHEILIRVRIQQGSLFVILILMTKSKIQPFENNLYDDEDWNQVKSTLLRQYLESQHEYIVNDQLFIQEQSELMQDIKEKIKRKKNRDMLGSMEVLPLDSSISNISSHYNFADDESLIKNKFAQQFESSLVNSALKQVKQACSQQTYETIRNYVINNKQKECQNLGKMLDKKNKENEELSLAFIMKQNELVQLKEEMAPYITKIQYFNEEKKKWKKKHDQVNQKQILLHKMERALIFKEKMHQEAKRRCERLKEFTDGIYTKMKQIESDLNHIRINIENQMKTFEDQACCPEAEQQICWKKEIMKKFRQKLLEQRSILKQQEKHLEKRYQILENISQQCKKLVSESYQGLVSTVGSGGSAINISSRQQRHQKLTSMSVIDRR